MRRAAEGYGLNRHDSDVPEEFLDAAENACRGGHALWRKVVAAAIAVTFAFSLIFIGLICSARAAPADERSISNPAHR